MISQKRIWASQINGQKSRGPKSWEGKIRASQNSFRHGLNTIHRLNPIYGQEIADMVQAICDGQDNPTLVEQAIIIAECAVLLRYVRAEQTAAIDRCRDPATVSHRRAGWSCAPARARLNQFDVAHAELTRRLAAAPAAGSANRPAQRSKKRGAALAVWKEPKERDETEAMRAAMPQLNRLARYERRNRPV